MGFFFAWIGSLTDNERLIALLVFAMLMAVIPFISVIKTFIITVFGTRPPRIDLFSHTISGEKERSLLPNKAAGRSDGDYDFLIEGSRLMFHWKVFGARRVDLLPVGKNLRGNSASTIIQSVHTRYLLRAYGFFGKVAEAEIEFPKHQFRRIDTRPFSTDIHLVRDLPSIETNRLSSRYPLTHPISSRLPEIILTRPRKDFQNRRLGKLFLEFFIDPSPLRRSIYRRIDAARILKGLHYSPSRYDEAVHKARQETRTETVSITSNSNQ